jgi:tetratricopeptide (TPR) repeat protein
MSLRVFFPAVLAILSVVAPRAAFCQKPGEEASEPALVVTKTPPEPDPPRSLIAAKHLLQSGKLDDALNLYKELAGGPDAASAYAGIARVYLRRNNAADAFVAATKAVSLKADSADAHCALGEVLFRKGQIIASQKEFLPFVHADQASCYLDTSKVLRAASFYKSAKVMIDKAYSLDPDDPEIARRWSASAGVEDQIKALQAAVNSPDDASRHAMMMLQLAILREHLKNRRPCTMVSKSASTSVPLDPLLYNARALKGYGLKVKLNDVANRLLVDTGASGILVTPRVAEKAGLKRLSDTKIGGVGSEGVAAAYVAAVENIQIGDLEFHDCTVDVVEKKTALDVDGLIGADVFSGFLVELDFPNAKLNLKPLPAVPDEPPLPPALESVSPLAANLHNRYVAPEMRGYTPVFRFGHQLMVETWIKDSPSMLFLLDTGAFSDQISPAVASAYTKVREDTNIKVTGLNGKVDKVYTADNVILQFGHLRQLRQNMIAWDFSNLSSDMGVEVSGILGFDVLRLLVVRIDYRDGLVDLEYTPHVH